MTLSQADVWNALAAVIHPSFGINLVALGMVRAVRVHECRVEVDLVINCAGCPGPSLALEHARLRLIALSGRQVSLSLLPETWTPPWE